MRTKLDLGRECRQRRTTGPSDLLRGRYVSLIVGPAIGLTALCSHAQSLGDAQVGASAPLAAKDMKGGQKNASPTDTTTLNTIEITANRRREPAREVPMQVNALSAQDLERKGNQSMRDYLTTEPGVSMSTQGAGQSQISMRGITTGTDISPTVGVYVDEVPFGSSTVYGGGAALALDMGLLDLNHIELLRGPQGTLYGAGAMGGLLKYVTNEPDTEGGLSGRAGVMFSGTRYGGLNHTENAVVNVPIKEGVAALRVSAFNQNDGGFINRIGGDPQRGVNGATTRGGRASLLLTPGRDLTIRLTATTQKIKRDGTAYVDYNFATRQPLYGDLEQNRKVNEPFDQSIQLYSANIEYDFGWGRLNAVSAYQSLRTTATLDQSTSYVPLLNGMFGAPVYSTGYSQQHIATKKFTQEFRLTSPGKQTLEWVAGLFYTNERSTNNQNVTLSGPGVSTSLLSATLPSTYKEYAAYGDLTYHLSSRLAATVGLRVAHNRQEFNQTTSGLLAGSKSLSAQSSDTSKTFLFTLNYLLTPNSSVYGRIASGYRPGGPQPSLLDLTTGTMTPSTFKPDTLTSYELGYKADFLDKRASLSVSLFDIEWKDIQLHDAVNGLGVITNGGKARSRGMELFGSLTPTPQWRFSMGMTYSDGRLTQDVPGIQARSGDRMPNTPTFAGSANADYFFDVASYRAYVGATVSYVGQRNSSFPNTKVTPNFNLPSYVRTDLRAGIDLRKARVAMFVHNLFDRRGMQSAATDYVPLGGAAQVAFIQPRTVGVQLDAPF
ncbi:ligand-gated channel [Pandoraea horticolens]|uniref:Ligand-gated channel n=1 Tax=Pandoraea horticolens TaxID=2508298 RepID=A0A5E4VSR0_9BURK|nr:ligand-gated channel [Pandoraea horticolens]